MGASYLLKKAILLKSVIFQWNTQNGIGFKWKIWYSSVISVKSVNFQLFHHFLLKNSEWYSICLKKLVFLLKQTIFHDKASVGRRLSFENWLKSVISLKLGYFMKI